MEETTHSSVANSVAQQIAHDTRHEHVLGPGKVPVTLRVNGEERHVWLEPRRTLLDALRIDLDLTGTKLVCGRGECGACTVQVDGEAVYACLMLAVECVNRDIETIEGLRVGTELHPLQQAFIAADAFQCGFCTPGQIMALKSLLDREKRLTEDDIRRSVSGNLCRCGAYHRILRAALMAAESSNGRS